MAVRSVALRTGTNNHAKASLRGGIALVVVLAAAAAVFVKFVMPPGAPSPGVAERVLEGPPTFIFAGEHGSPRADCSYRLPFGLGGTDDCTLTFPSGDEYHCSVGAASQANVGMSAACESRPFHRGPPSSR
jgi:hypothetical protein